MFKKGKYFLTIFMFLLLFVSITAITSYASDINVTYDANDATANIASAISAANSNPGADRVILSYQGTGTKWISGPIQLGNDTELVLEEGVILESKSGAFPSTSTPFILISGKSNVTITGYNATIRMLLEEYTSGEWRHGVSIRSSENVSVKGVTLEKSGGDGIYLGSNGTPNNNILIEDVTLNGNARNEISVISAQNLTINRCVLKNTGEFNPTGVASGGPWAAIDFEPNTPTEVISNIVMSNCTIDNVKYGIQVGIGNLTTPSTNVSISFENIAISNSTYGLYFANARAGVVGLVEVDGCTITDSETMAVRIREWSDSLDLNINNCTIKNPMSVKSSYGAINIESATSATYSSGNVDITNTFIYKNKSPYSIRLAGANTTYPINNVNATVYTDHIDPTTLYNTYYNNINVTYNPMNVSFNNQFASDVDNIGGLDNEDFFTNSNANIYTGDFNGDGRTDLFVKGYSTTRAMYLAKSAGNGFTRAFLGSGDGVGGTDSEAFFTNSAAKIYTGDYNGDGKTDLFVKGYGTWRALYLANSTGNGFDCVFASDADGVGGTDSEAFFTDATANIYTGDFNGDGKTDLFVKGYGTYRALYHANSTGDGFDCIFAGDADDLGGTDSDAFLTDASAIVYPGDYNGDGKTDLFIKGYGVYRALYYSNGAGFTVAFATDVDNVGGTDSEVFLTSSSAIVYTGDFNADGKTDLFVKGYSTYRALYVGTATGFSRSFMSNADGIGGTDSEAFFTNASAKIYVGDYNGDGRDDLFVKGYGTYRALYLANSATNSFTCVFSGDADGLGGTDSDAFFTDSTANLYTGDYNGDGKTDIFLKGYGLWRALYTAAGSF